MKSLWILSEQRRLEVQKNIDTLTQTSDFSTRMCVIGVTAATPIDLVKLVS